MRNTSPIPSRTGLGLKAEHYRDIVESSPAVGFFEVHAENYMGEGGPPHRYLARIREDYPLSLHGVGLSIGGNLPLDQDHLRRLRSLSDRYEPALFSEHLAWSTHKRGFLGDLLPLPYTDETLRRVCDHIDQTQAAMGRQMLLENPSSYLTFEESTYRETDFIRKVAKTTGCGLLLDVSNVFVSAMNLKTDPFHYVDLYPLDLVQEFHLAGHEVQRDNQGEVLLIDAHGSPVASRVWTLFEYVISKTGRRPTLIEWDNSVPTLNALIAEAQRADDILFAGRLRAA